MKKLFAILLIIAMLLSLAACGDKGGSSISDKLPQVPTEAGKESESTKPAKPAATEPAPGGETLETTLWTLNYDPDDGWKVIEDELYDSESSSGALLLIPESDEEDAESLVTVEIRVFLGDPYTFRDWLDSYGFDHYEYAVEKSYPLTNVGGVDCLTQEGTYWGEPALRYLNRVEGAEATVFIEVLGQTADERVEKLLSGLSIRAEDVGNVDGPWYWNGTPFSAENRSAMVGTVTVNSQWIPFTDCMLTKETFKHFVAVAGDKAYLVSEGVLKQYAFDGSKLTFETDIPLDAEYQDIYAANDGTLWLSNFIQPLIGIRDGVKVASYSGPDYVAMHPSGTWGISWFSSGTDCEKFDISGGAYTVSPLAFNEVKTVSHLMLDEDYIYVCGYAESDGKHRVYVYNAAGELQLTLDDADGQGLGSITFMAQTSNGFIGLDGNMRKVVLWNAEGAFIGEIDDSNLFGTSYPWFCGAAKLPDGSILVIMTEDRADRSAMELVAFKLSGF
jgi:predicted small lipoprotein YifL